MCPNCCAVITFDDDAEGARRSLVVGGVASSVLDLGVTDREDRAGRGAAPRQLNVGVDVVDDGGRHPRRLGAGRAAVDVERLRHGAVDDERRVEVEQPTG